jgi:hypothetical protein
MKLGAKRGVIVDNLAFDRLLMRQRNEKVLRNVYTLQLDETLRTHLRPRSVGSRIDNAIEPSGDGAGRIF